MFNKKCSNMNDDLPIPSYLRKIFKPEGKNTEYSVTGSIVCECGNKEFQVLSNEEKSVVAVKCLGCGAETEIFNANKHGCDGFVCGGGLAHESEVSGNGCENCPNNGFLVKVTVRSQGKEDFIEESGLQDSEGRGLSEEDWADAFEWICIGLECARCHSDYPEWLEWETM